VGDLFLDAEVSCSERIEEIDHSECAARSRLFHCRPEGADDLIDSEAGRRGSQVLEVDDMMLDLGAKEGVVERPPGEDDYAGISVVCLQQAKTFTADQACCTEE